MLAARARGWVVFLVVGAAGCAATPMPKAEPAALVGVGRRPVKPVFLDDETPNSVSTLKRIHVDPGIAQACNAETSEIAFDSASFDPADDLDTLVTCLMTGPLHGRTLELGGDGDGVAKVEAYLELHGLASHRIRSMPNGRDATPKAPTAERVDIGLGD